MIHFHTTDQFLEDAVSPLVPSLVSRVRAPGIGTRVVNLQP